MPDHGEDPEVAAAVMPVPAGLKFIDPEARDVIGLCLQNARERLGMDIAWLAEFRRGEKVFRAVEGNCDEWEIWDDSSMPDSESYCLRMLRGQIPNAIPDTAREPAVADLAVTRDKRIGAYVGVPLLLPDGTPRGAFCCARHTPTHTLTERDVRFLQVMARMVAAELAYRETVQVIRRQEGRSVAAAALVSALQQRDGYTAEHSFAVVELAGAVAQRLGLAAEAVAEVERVALLHDIGKVATPEAILHKPGPLTEEEEAVMREHPATGETIVERIEQLAHLGPAIRAEHERWDGQGYPDGIASEEIPVESRIAFVCDAFHAMVSDRPYRAAQSHEHAVAELRRCSGSMFWPAAVDALLAELDQAGG